MGRKRRREDQEYETFYVEWITTRKTPPRASDFGKTSADKDAFRRWAKKNNFPLCGQSDEQDRKYQDFYNDYLRKHGKPPCASDYCETKKERETFRRWATRNKRPLRRYNAKPTGYYYIHLAELCEPYFNRGATISETAKATGLARGQVKLGYWMCEDDPTDVEDDPRACEPEYVKGLCDELRERGCVPPRLLPEEWARYLDVRRKHLATRMDDETNE